MSPIKWINRLEKLLQRPLLYFLSSSVWLLVGMGLLRSLLQKLGVDGSLKLPDRVPSLQEWFFVVMGLVGAPIVAVRRGRRRQQLALYIRETEERLGKAIDVLAQLPQQKPGAKNPDFRRKIAEYVVELATSLREYEKRLRDL